MSAVVKAVKSVAKAAFKVVEQIGEIVVDVVDAVVDVVEDVGRAVGDAVQAVNDVLGDIKDFAQVLVERYAIQAALMAVGIPPVYAAPMSAGMHTLAKGGTPEDALKSAATTTIIQQAGKAISEGMQAANADAVARGLEPTYSAVEIAAATSAAQSAIATAAVDGDFKDVVLGAAIGGVTGAAATEVYNQTGSLAAANFTRVTMQATLQGVEVEQAILMGASASMVSYLQNMNETATKATEIANSRAASLQAYKNRVDGYNQKLNLYNQAKAANNVELANQYATELNAELVIIKNLSSQIGSFNQQLKELSDQYLAEQAKAKEEAKKTDFDFKSKTEQQLALEEQQRDELADRLAGMISETEGRRYEGIEIAGELPAGIDESFRSLPLVGEDVINQTESPDAIRRTVVGTNPQGEEYSYNIVIDKTDGSVFYETFGGEGLSSVTTAFEERPVFTEVGGQGVADVSQLVATRPTLTEAEISAINEMARQSRGTSIRGAVEQELFEEELDRFEADLKAAEDAAKQDAARAKFVTEQRQRLAQANRLPGTLQSQIDAELEAILDEYEESKGRAGAAAATKERVVASQQGRTGSVSDEEVMRLLGLSPGEGERYGLRPGGGGGGFAGIPEGVIEGPEGEMELGGGEGEGEPTEVSEQRFDAQGRPITTTAAIRPQQERQLGGRGETPGIPSRVTGEALVGILGDKEPLFGGDEDEQRAVWNRRSLRLRKALGL
jgi:hypothetical protein